MILLLAPCLSFQDEERLGQQGNAVLIKCLHTSRELNRTQIQTGFEDSEFFSYHVTIFIRGFSCNSVAEKLRNTRGIKKELYSHVTHTNSTIVTGPVTWIM